MCVCEFRNNTTQYNGAHASARVPGGARLHDYWQQASKRGVTWCVNVNVCLCDF